MSDPFANFADDDLEATIKAPLATKQPPASYKPLDYSEPCTKCRGTGRFRNLGPCFACKGRGKKIFKTAPAARAKHREQSAAHQQKVAGERQAEIATQIEQFKTLNPIVFAWIHETKDFEFAQAMAAALAKYGSLTINQVAACERCIDGRQRANAARAAREQTAPEIAVTRIEQAFDAARASGLKKLRLMLDVFEFKRAKATGKNPGAIYVVDITAENDDGYLGKIVGGKFIRVRSCDDAKQARVLAAAADPEKAAVAYGKLTGSCSCCGRELSDPDSIARGIGPICADRYGW